MFELTTTLLQMIYNEGWGQRTDYYPEFELTERVRQLDPTRLVDSTSGWIDHGAGDFSVCTPPCREESHVGFILTFFRTITTTRIHSVARRFIRPPQSHTTLPESGSRASLVELERMSPLSISGTIRQL